MGNIIESGRGWIIIGFLISFGLFGMVIWRSRKQQKKLESELRSIKDSIDSMAVNMNAGFDRLEAAMNRMETSMNKMATSINKLARDESPSTNDNDSP